MASLWREARPTREPLTWYGKRTEVVFGVHDVWRRDVTQQVRAVVLEGAKAPISLVGTALSLSALQLSEMYGTRCPIELTSRDLQQHCGLGDDQWTMLAILCFGHRPVWRFVCGVWSSLRT